MQKKIIILFLSLLLCFSSWAQQTNILSSASPKLRQFLIDHPTASKLLTNTLSEAFSDRTVQLYYFYSDDESVARAVHYYPHESAVVIAIRENQEPSDEFFCLIFEMLNSEGEKRFQRIFKKAASGTMSRTDFANEMLKVEFEAVKRMRDLVGNLKFNDKEIAKSHYYKRFIECPNKFEDFLAYTEKLSSPHQSPAKEYEAQYDLLRKTP